eukprot:GAHX01000195.1.p1 GENE.GAHX01000195.1~~GAHX01000195.1.p1  ORF type:complete len:320 (+),score=78.92 GAHX01000195.1:37-996(+)
MTNLFLVEQDNDLTSDSDNDESLLFTTTMSDRESQFLKAIPVPSEPFENRKTRSPQKFSNNSTNDKAWGLKKFNKRYSLPSKESKLGYLFLDENSCINLIKKLLLSLNSPKPSNKEENIKLLFTTFNQFVTPQILNNPKKALYMYNMFHSSNILKVFGNLVVLLLTQEINKNGPATDMAVLMVDKMVEIINKLINVFFSHKTFIDNVEDLKTYSPSLLFFIIGELYRKSEKDSCEGFYENAIKAYQKFENSNKVTNVLELPLVFEAKAKVVRDNSGDLEEISSILYKGFLETKSRRLKDNLKICLDKMYRLAKEDNKCL